MRRSDADMSEVLQLGAQFGLDGVERAAKALRRFLHFLLQICSFLSKYISFLF